MTRQWRSHLMSKLSQIFVSLLALTFASMANAQYVGFGSVTNGAADCPGFETYRVTSLNDSGPGTLRDAVSADCRNIVFDVAGEIELADWLLIERSFLTIDGSSAPAPGITIYAPFIRFAIQANASIGDVHDIIIHHLRVVGAGGDQEAADILELDGQDAAVYNIVFDHITAVGASDGAFDIWGEVHDVTLSYNLSRDMIKAAHFSRDSDVRENFTIHGNVYARNNERQIRMRYNNRSIDITNNVVYGWGFYEGGAAGLDLPSDPGYSPSINFENNIYHLVPGNGSGDNAIIFNSGSFPGDIFFNGNQLPSGENDAVSTAGRTPIPAYAEVIKRPTSELAGSVVACAGTVFPTQEEVDLISEIRNAIGGSGGSCDSIEPPRRPSAPQNLTIE
jgi:hypothetical protein